MFLTPEETSSQMATVLVLPFCHEYYHDYPHCTDGQSEAQRAGGLPEVTYVVRLE
jgi:hypothetical protein